MKFYINVGQDCDGYNTVDSITDYPIISACSYTLFWDTDKYGWITVKTLYDLDDLISKNPSLLYNGYCEVLVDGIDLIDSDILKEIFGTSDYEVIENNIDWQKLVQKSKDKLIFPKEELYACSEDDDTGYCRYLEYTQYIHAKNGELTYVGKTPKEFLQFIKDNCYKE